MQLTLVGKPAAQQLSTTNRPNKRPGEDHQDNPPSKSARHTSLSSSASDESDDLNDPAWNLQRLREPHEFFAHVCNRWRSAELPDPHRNLTFRNNPSFFNSGFVIPGNEQRNIHLAVIYEEQIRIINESLRKVRKEIGELQRTMGRRGRNWARIEFLLKYNKELDKNLGNWSYLRDSAYSFYQFYHDCDSGWDANYISAKQKAEADHLRNIVKGFKNFYGCPTS